MKRLLVIVTAAAPMAPLACVPGGLPPEAPPIETSLAFVNFDLEAYAALEVRVHDAAAPEAPYVRLPLLPPGATHRERFLDLLGDPCPARLDVRVSLYERVNGDLPIGLDPGEQVEPLPTVAGEVLDLPACDVQTLETYTIVNFETDAGLGRLKFAQDTLVDAAIRASGRFDNVDAFAEVTGLAEFAGMPPPGAEALPISGRVTLADGTGVADIGVLVRTRFRVRLNDGDAANDPDAGFGPPIDVRFTDAEGRFAFARPAGGYQVEFFSDDFLFRPPIIEIESPNQAIQIVVEGK